ncbi:PqiC family protein [Azospirillum sp. sgz301742]
MPAFAFIRRCLLSGLMAAIALAGCAGTQPRLYVLAPMAAEGAVTKDWDRSVGVPLVTLPEYLDRSEIVSYASTNELHANRDDRWAERLPTNVTRVLAENLSILLATDRVHVMPTRNGDRPDYEVIVEFDRFQRTAAGQSVLDAHWAILDGTTRKTLVRDQTRMATRVPDDGYASLVAAMNENLTALSRDIARGFATLPQKGGRRVNS